jgi:hypothetical protein
VASRPLRGRELFHGSHVDKVAIPGLAELPVVGGKGESNGSIFTQPLVVYLGLGLTLVKGLIELHDGSVSVQSEGVDRGTAFEVRLPLASD